MNGVCASEPVKIAIGSSKVRVRKQKTEGLARLKSRPRSGLLAESKPTSPTDGARVAIKVGARPKMTWDEAKFA